MPPDPDAPDGLTLGVVARGTRAEVTLRNDGPVGVRVAHFVDAGERHYDWYTVVLADGTATRTLRFSDDRNEAARVVADLAPGGQVDDVLDLEAWARRKPNGSRPLQPGTYRLRATYEVREDGDVWNGALVSPTVPITVP